MHPVLYASRDIENFVRSCGWFEKLPENLKSVGHVVYCSISLVVYREYFANMSLLCYHGCVLGIIDIREDREMGVVVRGRVGKR